RKTNYKKDKIVVSSRIYYADNKFSALCVDYLPIQYEKDIEALNSYQDSIFKYLYENYNKELRSGYVEFSAVTIDRLKEYMDYESIKSNKALLLINAIEYDDDNNEIMYSNEYVNTDIIKFSSIRRRE